MTIVDHDDAVDLQDPGVDQAVVIDALGRAGSALRGVDVVAARAEVDRRFARRLRIERISAGSAALLLVIALVVVTQLSGSDPDSIVADGVPERSSTTTTSTVSEEPDATVATTASSLPPPPVLPLPAPSTTAPAPPVAAVPAAPPAPAPLPSTTSTTIANRPLSASLEILTPVVATGERARVEVAWADEDHADSIDAQVIIDWGDDVVSASAVPQDRPACDRGGGAADGRVSRGFVYATPGVQLVSVTVTTCSGLGAFGETVTLSGAITVGDSREAVEPSVALVVSLPSAGWTDEVPPLVAAQAQFTPAGGGDAVELDERPPEEQYTSFGVASVLRVPPRAHGVVTLRWPGSSCELMAPVDLRELPADEVPMVELTGSC